MSFNDSRAVVVDICKKERTNGCNLGISRQGAIFGIVNESFDHLSGLFDREILENFEPFFVEDKVTFDGGFL